MNVPARPDTEPDNEFVLRSVGNAELPPPPWSVGEVIGTVFLWVFMLGCFGVVAQTAVKIWGDR